MFNSDFIVQICDVILIHVFVYVPGHKDVVKLLILTRADINMKMGDLTAVDIARDFGHSYLLELFQS